LGWTEDSAAFVASYHISLRVRERKRKGLERKWTLAGRNVNVKREKGEGDVQRGPMPLINVFSEWGRGEKKKRGKRWAIHIRCRTEREGKKRREGEKGGRSTWPCGRSR